MALISTYGSRSRIFRESEVAGALLLAFGVTGIVALHFDLRLSWHKSVVPVAGFMALQFSFLSGMYLVKKYKDLLGAIAISGIYLLAEALLAIYYGTRWRLWEGHEGLDPWWFITFIAVATFTIILLPFRWTEALFTGIRCARCGHYHRGHDCRCGCRAAEFKHSAVS